MADIVVGKEFFPLNEIAEDLQRAALTLCTKYGRHILREVVIDPRFAMNYGMLPGATAELNTSVGTVTIRADRRAVTRTFCNKYFCNLPANHAGSHRGPCACDSGCAADGCPNKDKENDQ